MRKMLSPFALATAVSLTACQQPDIAACEAFVKERLKAPSSYRQIDLAREDRKLDWAAYQRWRPEATAIERTMVDTGRISRLDLTLTYEAQNGFGVMLRSSEMCRFRLVDGKISNPDLAVTWAKSRASAAALAEALGDPPAEGPRCCD